MEESSMDGQELIAFQIISSVGTATSSYIEAIQQAKAGDFEQADQLMQDGEKAFLEGHAAHTKLITAEADGKGSAITLLLVHAEDQLMTANAFKTIAKEFIDVYQRMAAGKAE